MARYHGKRARIYLSATAGGVAVLLVEQKLPFARWVAQRFCIVDKGRSVATGAMADQTLTFEHAGQYGFYCTNHVSDPTTGTGMAGLIIVE